MNKVSAQKLILVICLIMALLAPGICTDISYAMDETRQSEVKESVETEDSQQSSKEDQDENLGESQQDQEQNMPEESEIPENSKNENAEPTEAMASELETEPLATGLENEGPQMDEPMQISNTTPVTPGNGTLQQAIQKATDGDVLQLARGDYTGSEIVIDKSITITGVSSSVGNASKILPSIKIEGTEASDKVVLENVFLGNQNQPTIQDYKYLYIVSPVQVDFNNINNNYIYRGGKDVNAVTLEMGPSSGGSTVNFKDSYLMNSFRGLDIRSSNNHITLDNTFLFGKLAIILAKGGNKNTLDIQNGSTVSGRSASYVSDEAIQIIGQTELTINIKNSKINGNDARGDRNTHVFSFDGQEQSSNVKINISGTSEINDINPIKGSTIFNFGESNTPGNTNIITIGKDVKITPNKVDYKYNVDPDYAVVGIYDKEGNVTIKAYSKGESLPEDDYNSISSDWYKVTDTTTEFDITSPITENMDLHPIPEDEISVKVKIAGQEQEYDIPVGKTYTENNELKNALEALKSVENKEFSEFVTQDNTKIDENTKIYKDTTITPKYKVTVTVTKADGSKDTYKIQEGESLSYISQGDLDQYEKATNDGTRGFSRYLKVGGTKYSTVSKSDPINEDIEIKPIYYVTVTINVEGKEVAYNVDEGESLQAAYATLATFKEIQNFVNSPNKVFQYFVKDETTEQADYNTPITKHTKLTAKYKVKVTVYQADGNTKDYLLEVGQKLSQLEDFEALKASLEIKGKDIDHYINEKGKEVTFETPVTENMSFQPVYATTVRVNIKGQVYEMEEGENLNSLGEQKTTQIKESVKEEGKDLAYFVEEGVEGIIDFETPITKNITLKPVYKVTITVLPKTEEVETFEVLEGTKFQDMQSELEKYKLTNKQLENFVYKEGEAEVKNGDSFTSHTTIVPKYTITIKVKNGEKEEALSGKIAEGTKLEDLQEQLNQYEQNLTGKHFANKYVDAQNEEREILKTQELTENITIIPKYNVEVTINTKKYTIPENSTLEALEYTIRQDVKVENKTFSHLVDGAESPVDFDDPISKDVTLTPKYKVLVTVVKKSGETVLEEVIPEESNLQSLGVDVINQLKEDLKIEKKVFAEKFTANIEGTFDFSTEIMQNITLTPMYNVEVTIKGKTYTLPEEGKIENLVDKLSEIESAVKVDNKTFAKKFTNDKKEVVTYGTSITESTTLTPMYNVEVMIEGETYTLAEGEKLNNLQKNELSAIETAVEESNKKFANKFTNLKGEVVTYETAIKESTTLTPMYNVEVTIKGETYTLAEGETLNNLQKNELSEIETAVQESNKTFAKKFTNLAGKTVTYETAIKESTTLTPMYNVEVTIKGETYTLPEGGKLKDFEGLSTIETAVQESNKTFAKEFTNLKGDNVTYETAISENTTLTPKYNITVKVGSKSYTLEENQTLANLKPSELEEIQTFANTPSNKTFADEFVDKNGKIVDYDTELNVNTELTPKYNVTLTIGGKTITIEEGQKLAELSETKEQELRQLVERTDKQFVGFVEIDDNTPIMENRTLTPKYNVRLTIPGRGTMDIEEGKKLSELSSEQKQQLKKLVERTDKQFASFEEIDDNTSITENRTLTPKYTVDIQIGEQSFTVDEGKTLKELIELYPDAESALENLEKSKDKPFNRFTDQDDNTIEENTKFTKNTTIIPKYKITITVQKNEEETEEIIIEEGKTLNTLSQIYKERLQAIKNNHQEGFRFVRFINAITGEEIGENTPITEDMVIKPIYEAIPVTEETVSGKEDTKSNSEIINPKTSDQVLSFVVIGLVGFICIGISIIAYRKRNK